LKDSGLIKGGRLKKALVLILLLTLPGFALAQEEQEEIKANTCYTESVEVEKGTSFPVKVFLNNVDTLAAFSVPIYYRSETVDLECDSVTFHGSRAEHFSLSFFKVEPVGKVVFFAFLWVTDPDEEVPPLGPGEGMVAELWFTAPEDIKAGKVELDSGPNAFFPHEHVDYSYEFTTPMAVEVDFEYTPGLITVK
jgi:hypothetical protein